MPVVLLRKMLTSDLVRSQGHEKFPCIRGISHVTVPGSVRGWEYALNDLVHWAWTVHLLQQPIDYARNGYPVSQRIARAWHRSTEKMSAHPDSKRVWLPNGKAPKPAEIFQNP